MSNKNLLVLLGAISLIATILGFVSVISGKFSEQTFIFYPIGIFIWGDAIILGPFLALCSVWLYRKNEVVLTGLALSLYYSTRSFIEILYGLNAQFSSLERPWEAYWLDKFNHTSLAISEIHVLYQLVFTCVFVTSSLSFLHFLRRYFKQT